MPPTAYLALMVLLPAFMCNYIKFTWVWVQTKQTCSKSPCMKTHIHADAESCMLIYVAEPACSITWLKMSTHQKGCAANQDLLPTVTKRRELQFASVNRTHTHTHTHTCTHILKYYAGFMGGLMDLWGSDATRHTLGFSKYILVYSAITFEDER